MNFSLRNFVLCDHFPDHIVYWSSQGIAHNPFCFVLFFVCCDKKWNKILVFPEYHVGTTSAFVPDAFDIFVHFFLAWFENLRTSFDRYCRFEGCCTIERIRVTLALPDICAVPLKIICTDMQQAINIEILLQTESHLVPVSAFVTILVLLTQLLVSTHWPYSTPCSMFWRCPYFYLVLDLYTCAYLLSLISTFILARAHREYVFLPSNI